MPFAVDITKSPYGLSGGVIFSGSVSASVDGFLYWPITATSASIFTSNLVGATGSAFISGSITSAFTVGIGMWGNITSVTQSSGIAIVYNGTAAPTRF